MEIFGIAQQGLERAQEKLETTASRVARGTRPAPAPAGPDNVDLSQEMIALMQARDGFLTNVRAIQSGDEMVQKTLDILA
jgi:flagellar basal body rod protein FlgC